ncbi:hypothetical protein B0T26DRAFT_810428, partial [Lasiosphaeria miniovina]
SPSPLSPCRSRPTQSTTAAITQLLAVLAVSLEDRSIRFASENGLNNPQRNLLELASQSLVSWFRPLCVISPFGVISCPIVLHPSAAHPS